MTKRILTCLLAILLLVCVVLVAPAAASPDDIVVVSLGDSYSSGEGNPPFYGQNPKSKYSDLDWVSHRSRLSWPGQLSVDGGATNLKAAKGKTWFFQAVSGAVAYDIYGPDDDARRKKEVSGHEDVHLSSQLTYVDEELKKAGLVGGDVDYVTLTIGGNDLGFADIVTQVALRNGAVDRGYLDSRIKKVWKKYEETSKEEIKKSYTEIANRYPNAHLIVAGYPTLMNSANWVKSLSAFLRGDISAFFGSVVDYVRREKTFGFADWEAAKINEAAEDFNEKLDGLVGERDADGAKISFVSVSGEFAGHEIDTEVPFINDVMLRQAEDLGGVASAYSAHPNSCGVDYYEGVANCGIHAYTKAMQEELDYLLAKMPHAPQSGGAKLDTDTGKRAAASLGPRSISLVLDVSSSMSGEPLEQTKRAASSFVDTVANDDARIGMVTFSDEAAVAADLGQSPPYIKAQISGLSDSGGTNMEVGLVQGSSMLDASNGGKRIMVLMSDGDPTTGKQDDELIAYARSLRDTNGDGRDETKIYALGFNESSYGQYLLANIASAGCHYEVQDANDLEAFFADIADEINGTRFIYARVACPVNVTVTHDGETLSSVGESPQKRTSFGSLTFEEAYEEGGTAPSDPIKVLRLKEGESYNISIEGYDDGVMDYSVGFLNDEGDYDDFRTFSGVKVSSASHIATRAEVSDSTLLEIDDDGDGKVDQRLRARANEEGVAVDNGWVVRLVFAGFAVVGLLVVSVVLVRKFARGR